jgi:hypothetical protein
METEINPNRIPNPDEKKPTVDKLVVEPERPVDMRERIAGELDALIAIDNYRNCICGSRVANSGWNPHRNAHLKAAGKGFDYTPSPKNSVKPKSKGGRPKGSKDKPKSVAVLPPVAETLVNVVEAYAGETLQVAMLADVMAWIADGERLIKALNT